MSSPWLVLYLLTLMSDMDTIEATPAAPARDESAHSAGLLATRFALLFPGQGSQRAGMAARLIEIANKCPVHRTLENEIKVVTREGGSGG